MIHNILVVDDNQPFLSLISKIFDKYKDKYSIHTSIDGKTALELLRSNSYSLVISDLQMPNMDGYALLDKIRNQFPDIPVIIITAFDKPKTESVVKKTGAYAYFTKPLVVDNLISSIETIVTKETEGGKLHNASLEMFIQLIEMEAKTCTIRVCDENSQKKGVLFFSDGELYNARIGNTLGKNAAYTIFSWDKVTLSIENSCLVNKRFIQDELQAILLDAMRMKDEIGKTEDDFNESESEQAESEKSSEPASNNTKNNSETLIQWEEKEQSPEERAKNKLSSVLDVDKDLKSLSINPSWDSFTSQAASFGTFFGGGDLKAAYFDKNGSDNIIIVSNKDDDCIIEIIIGSRCSPDRVVKTLTE